MFRGMTPYEGSNPSLVTNLKSNSMYRLTKDSINGIKINEEIFSEKKSDWRIVHRESHINTLFKRIAEAIRLNSKHCEKLMKDALFMLNEWNDDYIFSFEREGYINTKNDYINTEDLRFNDVCEELLQLNRMNKLIEVKLKFLVEYDSNVATPEEILDMATLMGLNLQHNKYIYISEYLDASYKNKKYKK